MNDKKPLDDNDLDTLRKHLESLQTPMEPLDISAIDGLLAGVLLQPSPIPMARWWPLVVNPDQAAPPAALSSPQVLAIQALVLRRHEALNRAVHNREWFDPWVFELDAADAEVSDCLLPWVAGFALAMVAFPALMDECDASQTLEPLALIYAHFDTEDLEDADDLLDAIAEIEPASTLQEAVEDLVSAVLTLADVTRPRSPSQRAAGPVSASKVDRRLASAATAKPQRKR